MNSAADNKLSNTEPESYTQKGRGAPNWPNDRIAVRGNRAVARRTMVLAGFGGLTGTTCRRAVSG